MRLLQINPKLAIRPCDIRKVEVMGSCDGSFVYVTFFDFLRNDFRVEPYHPISERAYSTTELQDLLTQLTEELNQ